MIRPLVLLLALALTGLAPAAATAGTSGASQDSRPDAIQVDVDWPKAPVRGDRVAVHVTRTDRQPTTARLQVRSGDAWLTVKEKTVTTRTFTLRDRPEHNRYKLRVVLPLLGVKSRGYAAPQPAPLVRAVDYADDPVRPRPGGRKVTLLLDGKRGHRVQLATKEAGPSSCSTTRLRGPSGVVKRQDSGLWRLPRTGRYRLELVPCWGWDLTYADLTRVRLVPLEVDGEPVTLRRRAGVVDLGMLDVPQTGRVMARAWATGYPWSRIIRPTGESLRYYGASLTYFENGQYFHNGFNDIADTVTPGRHLLVPAEKYLVASASTALTTAVIPEGPAAVLDDGGVPGRERAFSFTGAAGTFYYPDDELPSWQSGGSGELVGPDGAVVRDWNEQRGWLLPADGTYTLYVAPSIADTRAGTPVTMRVRQAVSVPAMQYGTASRFTIAEPDRWVVATLDVPAPPYSHLFSAAGSTMTGSWEAILGLPVTNRCPPDPHGPLGCGENWFATVRDTVGETVYFPGTGVPPHVVVLRPGAGVTGAVDLTVGPRPAS